MAPLEIVEYQRRASLNPDHFTREPEITNALLPFLGYQTIVADPPWQPRDALGRRGAEANYPTLSTIDICRFPLPPLAPDCRLFLWRLSSMQQDALDVMRMWGFDLKAEIVWNKLSASGTAEHFGMGRTVRNSHEVCLIGTRGRPEVLNHSTRSTFSAPFTRHSGKPETFFDLVEALSPGPYVELFARRQREGWLCLGNEVMTAEEATLEPEVAQISNVGISVWDAFNSICRLAVLQDSHCVLPRGHIGLCTDSMGYTTADQSLVR